MKQKLVIVVFSSLVLCGTASYANEPNDLAEPIKMEATAYYEGAITASGIKPRNGICAAKKAWIGKTAIVYERKGDAIGDLIGIYEIEDTGSDQRIKEGKVIDIFIPDESECWEFGRKDVFVQIIEAKG